MYRRASRRVLVGSIAVLAAAIASLGGPAVGGAAEQSSCVTLPSGGQVCLQVNNNPNPVSKSISEANPSFLSNDVAIANNSGQTVTQLVYTLGPVAPGLATATFAVHNLPSACTYSSSSQLITCLPPSVPNGATATFSIPLKSPTDTGHDVALTSTLSFKESGNPDPGRVSSVPPLNDNSIEVTETGATATSAVPVETAVQLSITKNGQKGTANIPEQAFATNANISFTPTSQLSFKCPQKEICRTGDWVAAVIPLPCPEGPPKCAFDPLLQFTLVWPASSVSKKQTVANFHVFYRPDTGGLKTAKACEGTFVVLPCIDQVGQDPLTGNWFAIVLNNQNGHMR
jgi:hypothetical protein